MKKIYKVALSEEEQAELQALISKGKTSARKVTRARILLLAHAGEKDAAVARALQTSVSTVERTRKNLVLEGLKPALEEAPRPGAKPKLDAKGHSFLVALACSTPPLGARGLDARTPLGSARQPGLRGELFQGSRAPRALKKTTSSLGGTSSGPSRRRDRSSSGAWRR